MKTSTRETLLEFCKYMDGISEDVGGHFDMGAFLCHEDDDGEDHLPEDKDKKITKNDILTCGTSACALGWLAVSPVGRKMGLELYACADGGGGVDEYFKVRNKKLSGFAAAAALFRDLNTDQVAFLFGGHNAIGTPKQWADRCRIFLALDGDHTHDMLLEGVPGGHPE